MGPLAPSRINAAPGYYSVDWMVAGWEIGFEADRLRVHSDGRLQAQVRVTARWPGEERTTLSHEQLNLTAGQSRRGLSQRLNVRHPLEGELWDQLVEGSCQTIQERENQGSPTERLEPATSTEVQYMLGHLVLEGLPVLSFAPGGQFKSFLAIYKALLIENGLPFFGEPTRQASTLILDWEVSRAEAQRRCDKLINGLLQSNIAADIRRPFYRHCTGPIQDEASDIAKVIAKHDIRYVVIDSAGLAAGGDVASSEPTIQFFNTLRKVTNSTGAASDILTHVTKTDRKVEDQRRTTPIGSIYWENLARITWELRSEEERPGVFRVGFHCRKSNVGQLDSVGLRMTFDRDALLVDQVPVKDVNTEAGAIRAMLLEELKRGACGPKDLAEAIGTTAGTVSVTLCKLKDSGLVENIGHGKWTLAGDGHES
jgi:hypothetical protein